MKMREEKVTKIIMLCKGVENKKRSKLYPGGIPLGIIIIKINT